MPRTVNPDRAAERRRQILEAAHGCFVRKGFHQTSIDEICTAAEISPGGLYRYFASKDAIIQAIGEEGRSEVTMLLSSVKAGSDIVQGLSDLIGHFSEFFANAAEAGLGVELFAEALRNPVIAQSMRTAESSVLAEVAGVLSEGQKRGQIDSTLDPRQAATMLMAAADGLGLRIAIGHKITPLEAKLTLQTLLTRYLRPIGAAHHAAR